jgi:excisionase family DNA binding protein
MTDPMLIGFPEAAARLGVAESWLRRAVTAREVPHRRLGKRVMFTQADLDQIVAEAEVLAVAPMPERLAPSGRRRRRRPS